MRMNSFKYLWYHWHRLYQVSKELFLKILSRGVKNLLQLGFKNNYIPQDRSKLNALKKFRSRLIYIHFTSCIQMVMFAIKGIHDWLGWVKREPAWGVSPYPGWTT